MVGVSVVLSFRKAIKVYKNKQIMKEDIKLMGFLVLICHGS